jgi:predicted RNase H-like nuclease (RuvC/YqgF family)
MTIEQTTERIRSAAEAQNMAALQAANVERKTMIATLKSLPPSQQLRDAIAASLQAGEEAKRTIRLIKQCLRNDSRRLANIDDGFIRALRPVSVSRINYKG